MRHFSVCYLAYLLFASLPCVFGKADTTVNNKTIDRTIQLRTHSIFPPYIDQDLQNRWWDFGADAYIVSPGWLWSRMPLTASNFIIEVEFKVSGNILVVSVSKRVVRSPVNQRTCTETEWLSGSQRTEPEPGPVFGSKDNFEGLGILMDTYANSRHPYGFPRVMAMLGDGQTPYDQAHDGEANSLGSCSANFRRTNVITKLKITYLKDTYLDVRDSWSDCFRINGISLPSAPYIGISAMTGEVFDSHDVISVTTWSAVLSASDAQRNKFGGGSGKGTFSRKSGAESRGGSWLGFIFKLLLFVAICVGGTYGYKTYALNKRRGYGGSAFGGLGYESRRRF
ncbi:concanavalin A-like lectin/glucanase domain-containing protein [Suillus subaureus]|uniref:Concanavalin A-like lectin/glucanase domain-containing protein n=1 Tax=Suillus subaureus TaxID=48587 RepID=A0A9P7JIL6_9AGAM|nr:concanavalin A-like lectin/glucanase domain-containing protein [Suillus subaureus]KAG1824354.1 concanavalin A-like lectin/glucanase domain-containing protein [Suillus subaureus]